MPRRRETYDAARSPGWLFHGSQGVPFRYMVAGIVGFECLMFALLSLRLRAHVHPVALAIGLLTCLWSGPPIVRRLRGQTMFLLRTPHGIREVRYFLRSRFHRLDHLVDVRLDGEGATAVFESGELRIGPGIQGGARLAAWLQGLLRAGSVPAEVDLPEDIVRELPIAVRHPFGRLQVVLMTICYLAECAVFGALWLTSWPRIMWPAVVALTGLTALLPWLLKWLRRKVCLAVTAREDGLEIRRLAGRLVVPWRDVLGVQVTDRFIFVRTPVADWHLHARTPGANELLDAIRRVLALRNQGHALPGNVAVPETALSRLSGPEPAAAERGISLSGEAGP